MSSFGAAEKPEKVTTKFRIEDALNFTGNQKAKKVICRKEVVIGCNKIFLISKENIYKAIQSKFLVIVIKIYQLFFFLPPLFNGLNIEIRLCKLMSLSAKNSLRKVVHDFYE